LEKKKRREISSLEGVYRKSNKRRPTKKEKRNHSSLSGGTIVLGMVLWRGEGIR